MWPSACQRPLQLQRLQRDDALEMCLPNDGDGGDGRQRDELGVGSRTQPLTVKCGDACDEGGEAPKVYSLAIAGGSGCCCYCVGGNSRNRNSLSGADDGDAGAGDDLEAPV